MPLFATAVLALGLWIFTGRLLPAATAADAPHAGHDHAVHGEGANDPHAGHDQAPLKKDLDDLFAADDHGDEHAGHGHEEQAAAGHEEKDEEGHAGHDHASHGPGDGDCPEHGIPEVEDALCQPQLIETLQPGQGLKVRLAVADAAERIGIVASRPLAATDRGAPLPGQVIFNRNRLARLSTLAPGVVKRVPAELGARVEPGQILAEIASPEIAALRASLQTAQSRSALAEEVYLREQDLLARGISSRQEFQQAEAERSQARTAIAQLRQQLLDYGIAPADLQAAGSSLPLRAPFAGTLVERSAVVGEAVEAGAALFTVADLATLWIELSVPETRLLELHPGATVSASFSGLPGRAFPGEIFWVAPALDEKSRLLKALAELSNESGLLKAGLFGEVRLVNDQDRPSLAVPSDALQTIDGATYLFVALEPDLFELRRVEAGRRDNGTVTISRGLAAGDRVVSGQGFALKSEILKSRLGASCADH
jgi:cobalt-zinc-cadmium efflux system membrane fusion protein